MEVDLGVFLEPTLVLLVRIEIVEDDVKRAIREGGNEAVHEAEKLDAAAALGMGCDDPAGSDFERGEQGRGACSRGCGRSRRARSAASDSLAPAPRPGSKAFRRHREQSPWQGDRHRARPHRRLSPRTRDRCSRTRICGRQGRYCARAGSARHTEHQRRPMPWPAEDPSTGHSPAAAASPEAPECACSWPCRRSASCCPEPILQSAKAVLRKPPPPVADDARLNTHFRGDRTGAAALSRQQHYPRPPHIALRRARCPAARLKHLTYLRLEPNLSCFGNHPDLES